MVQPAAFAPPAKWTWGNSARNMLFGPGLWNWDIARRNRSPLREHLRLQFRADFLNAFNHMNLDNPDTTIADTRDGGTPNPTAGMITSGTGSRICSTRPKTVVLTISRVVVRRHTAPLQSRLSLRAHLNTTISTNITIIATWHDDTEPRL